MAKFTKANDRELATLAELIDDATSTSSENSKAFATICEIINGSSEGPKEAIKCIKKRFATKNPTAVKMTLSLLDSCVKNCGVRFQGQIFNKDFLQNLLKLIKPKNNPTADVQITVLRLIQRWAISFQGISEFREVCRTYEDLLNKNVEFPARDPEQLSHVYIMSTGGNPYADRRDSSCLTVYEVEPSAATLCPTGNARRKSVDPRFPHRNTLNPSGRSASAPRDGNPGGGGGGNRRASYIPGLGDDLGAPSGRRKQSCVLMLSEGPMAYGGERKKSYVGNVVYGGDRKQSYVGGGDRKQSYVGGQDRKASYVGNTDGQVPIVIVGQDRKRSCIGYTDGQIRVPALGSDRKQSYAESDRKQSHTGSDDRKPSYTGSTDGHQLSAVPSDMKQDLDEIRQDCQFFGEILSSVTPGKELASDKELLREYNLTCLEWKKRVVKWRESPEGGKYSDELLSLSDELNTVLFRYQKYSRSSASESSAKVVHPTVVISVEDAD